jgi:hypothetical protein
LEVRLIKRAEIDKLKWDSCVHYASNGNIYGYTWYLDSVADNWDGLVEGDYESVFPLIWNDKLLGNKQLYQPFLAQQTGIYSIHMLSQKRMNVFIEAIPRAYKKIVVHLNERNILKAAAGFHITPRTNFVLDLNKPYEELAANYSNNHKRNLKKARNFDNVINGNIKPEKLMALYKEHQGVKIEGFKEDSYHAAHRVIYNALHRGKGFMSGIQNKNGEWLAAAFLTMSHRRMTLLFPTTTPLGREQSTMHLLIDLMIQSNANKPMVLDFEGSSVETIARFYQGFGATDHPYFQLTKNELPFYLKWLGK